MIVSTNKPLHHTATRNAHKHITLSAWEVIGIFAAPNEMQNENLGTSPLRNYCYYWIRCYCVAGSLTSHLYESMYSGWFQRAEKIFTAISFPTVLSPTGNKQTSRQILLTVHAAVGVVGWHTPMQRRAGVNGFVYVFHSRRWLPSAVGENRPGETIVVPTTPDSRKCLFKYSSLLARNRQIPSEGNNHPSGKIEQQKKSDYEPIHGFFLLILSCFISVLVPFYCCLFYVTDGVLGWGQTLRVGATNRGYI